MPALVHARRDSELARPDQPHRAHPLERGEHPFFVAEGRNVDDVRRRAIKYADYAVGFLREHAKEHADDPFFLFLAPHAPHFPLQAPPEGIVADLLEIERVAEDARRIHPGLTVTVVRPAAR